MALSAEQVADLAQAGNVLAVVVAWRIWKDTHDRADAKHLCCDHTQKLFETLDHLEKEIMGIARPQ